MKNYDLNFISPKDLYFYLIDFFLDEENDELFTHDVVPKELLSYIEKMISKYYTNPYSYKSLFYYVSSSLNKSIMYLKKNKE